MCSVSIKYLILNFVGPPVVQGPGVVQFEEDKVVWVQDQSRADVVGEMLFHHFGRAGGPEVREELGAQGTAVLLGWVKCV